MSDPTGGDRDGQESSSASSPPTAGRRRAAGNIASMLGVNVVRRGAMLVIYLLVARHLGAHAFGQLSLAVVLLQSWHRFALVGMQTLLTREVALNRERTGSYFVHASVIGLIASLVGTALVVPFPMLMGYSDDTKDVIYLVFLGLTPLVLSQIGEGVFQGCERMDLLAYVNVPMQLLKIAAVYACIRLGYGIMGIAVSLSAVQLGIMFLQWILLVCFEGMPSLVFRYRLAWQMIRDSSAFLGIEATNAVRTGLTVAVLSKLCGETSVGVYSAANQLLTPFSMIFDNVALALFPAMCRGYGTSKADLIAVVQRVIEGLMVIAIPATTGLFMLSYPIVMLFYEDSEFLVSGDVLRIVVWSLITQALIHVMGRALWASSREKLSLRITVINTVAQAISCIVLTYFFGVIGAAVSVLLTSVISLIQHVIPTVQLLSVAGIASAIGKPLVASMVMAAVITCCREHGLAASIAYAVASYSLVLVALYVWAAGGVRQFRTACEAFWTA